MIILSQKIMLGGQQQRSMDTFQGQEIDQHHDGLRLYPRIHKAIGPYLSERPRDTLEHIGHLAFLVLSSLSSTRTRFGNESKELEIQTDSHWQECCP